MIGCENAVSQDTLSMGRCKMSSSVRRKASNSFRLSTMFFKMLIISLTYCMTITQHGFASKAVLSSQSGGRLGLSSKELNSSLQLESRTHERNISVLASRNAKVKYRRLVDTNRIGDICTMSDISVFQGHSSPLPNGIPTYTVQIINLCVVGCPLSNVHVACGWFASAKLVNPRSFRRLKYNDCLVNDGKPIKGGDSISFQYANSFEYPMKVARAETCRNS